MSRIYPLYSSSKGNSTYIGDCDSGVLIDAGVSSKRLVEGLRLCGIEPTAVKAIFITHEHSDHISGLKIFTKQFRVPVYSKESTVRYICENNYILPDISINAMPDDGIEINNIKIKCFNTSHDASESCGYQLTMSSGKKVAICTDLGIITKEVEKNIIGCDTVLLESNYDEEMLRKGSYPYMLKKRIMSERGHLSNDVSAQMIKKLVSTGTKRIILGHLSQENNTPDSAEEAVVKALSDYKRDKDYVLKVAPVCTKGDVVIF